jgi:hypothetical protein
MNSWQLRHFRTWRAAVYIGLKLEDRLTSGDELSMDVKAVKKREGQGREMSISHDS